ncbi:MBOAT family O-acyltransferase [Zhouia sp. PK063]|uniref:MBOAT family O-acyltransferase n=1 Tax=Zhouia sp. PK063 TaxID=3373602 RepID=UPI0037925B1C
MNRLIEIFTFSEKTPLIFTQANFWIFFAVVYFIYALLYRKKKARSAYLLLISLFFYYKTSGLFVGLLLFSTVVDFFIGKGIYKTGNSTQRKFLVTLSVLVNLLVLSYFKYAYFFTDAVNYLFHSHFQVSNVLADWGNLMGGITYFTVDKIILPVGISFYTFQTISYSVDIYRGKLKPLTSIIDFGFFVSFFPQLVAGPIVRASEFVPQIHKDLTVDASSFNRGSYLILKGLIKKMIFADFIAMHFLDSVFNAPQLFSGFTNVMAMIGYSLQIYGDFSGYTDIAIGLALLMGFELPVNFNSPYKALNCGDFWKRWHISLSTWLKDYLYIPLGGNRKGSLASYIITAIIIMGVLLAFGNLNAIIIIFAICGSLLLLAYKYPKVEHHINTNINILLTMLIGGLWHGASWKFVIWGGLNGLGVMTYKYWRKISPYEKATHTLAVVWKIAITFTFITFTRIYFRGESMNHIQKWYHQVWYNFDIAHALEVVLHYKWVFVMMLLGYVSHWLPMRVKFLIEEVYHKSPILLKGIVAIIVAVICYQAYSSAFQPFIYFQF